MKTSLLVLLVFFGTTALAQSAAGAGAMSAEPQIFEITGHAQHAGPKPMGQPDDLRGPSEVVHFHGERPLWEVAPKRTEVPLGDVARYYKKQHETAKKSDVIWEN